jgi:hypothetical protein
MVEIGSLIDLRDGSHVSFRGTISVVLFRSTMAGY